MSQGFQFIFEDRGIMGNEKERFSLIFINYYEINRFSIKFCDKNGFKLNLFSCYKMDQKKLNKRIWLISLK